MKFCMTGQEQDDLLIRVIVWLVELTTWTALTVYWLYIMDSFDCILTVHYVQLWLYIDYIMDSFDYIDCTLWTALTV